MTNTHGETFSKKSVTALIEQYGGEFVGTYGNKDVWILDDSTTVTLNKGFKRIPMEVVEIIAIDVLQISRWDFDLWLGEN